MAVRPHRRILPPALAAFAVGLTACLGGPAFAESDTPDAATWYIVGGPEDSPTTYGDRMALAPRRSRVDFGVTFARVTPSDVITFTSGPTSPRSERAGGYAFLVSGAYDFETGTLVTPRIVGGVGVSYVGAAPANSLAERDPAARQDVAPTAHIGFGADFDLGDTWAVSAEYRALYVGETERPGPLGESQLDQKFTVGAKIRF